MGECQSACEGDHIIRSELDQSHVVEYNGQKFLMPQKLSFNRQSTFSRVQNAAKVFCQKNNISPFYIPLVSRILAYRNQFVFQQIWNGLNQQQQIIFLDDLNSVQHDLMDSFYFHFVKKIMSNEQIITKKIKLFKPKYTKESEISNIQKKQLAKIGIQLINANKVAVVLMCAGSSSRFNYKTKFLYPLQLSTKVTMMDLIFKRLTKNCKTKLDLPIIINCNIHNIQQIKSYIASKKFYGFNQYKIKYYLTNQLAVFDRHGKYCLSSKMKLMKRPSGTGSCAQALIYNRIIFDYLQSQKIEYIYFSGMENLLENPCDPILLGLIYAQKRKIAAKCVGSKIISQNLPRYYSKGEKGSQLQFLSNNNLTPTLIKNEIFDSLPIAINSMAVQFQSLIDLIKDYTNRLFLAEKYHVVQKNQQTYNFRLFKTEIKQCVSFQKDIRDIISCVENPLLYKVSRKQQYAPIFTANHSYSLFEALNFYQQTLQKQISEEIL